MSLLSNQYVVLKCVMGLNGGFSDYKADFLRIHSDGMEQSGPRGSGWGWRVPVGQALVITDVDWEYIHPQGAAMAGKIEVLRLWVQNLTTPNLGGRVFESTITLSSHGEGGISEAMTSGFVVSSKARICPDVVPGPVSQGVGGLQYLVLRGYLIPDN